MDRYNRMDGLMYKWDRYNRMDGLMYKWTDTVEWIDIFTVIIIVGKCL